MEMYADAQGLGHRRRRGRRASTRPPSAAARPASSSSCACPTRSPRSRSSACGDRRQVPGAPHARRRGHVRRACRARLARALSSPQRAAPRSSSTPRRPRRSTSTAASTPPCSCRSTSRGGELHAVFTAPPRRPAPPRRRDLVPRRAPGRPTRRPAPTALREAEEEIGLPPDAVELVGALPPTPTFATNYAVYPFVGLIEPGHAWAPSAPPRSPRCSSCRCATLRAGYERRRLMRRGVPFRTDVYVVGEHLIWGATARILGDLLERLHRRPGLSQAAGSARSDSGRPDGPLDVLLDRDVDEVAPLGPRAVVVLDVVAGRAARAARTTCAPSARRCGSRR